MVRAGGGVFGPFRTDPPLLEDRTICGSSLVRMLRSSVSKKKKKMKIALAVSILALQEQLLAMFN